MWRGPRLKGAVCTALQTPGLRGALGSLSSSWAFQTHTEGQGCGTKAQGAGRLVGLSLGSAAE